MAAGKVIERGVIAGVTYRVWQRYGDGKKIVYITDEARQHGKTGRRRSMRWLNKHKKAEASP